jgi:hypothetical protein
LKEKKTFFISFETNQRGGTKIFFTGKQWHERKSAFRPRAGNVSWAKRQQAREAQKVVKAKERDMKAEKEEERQVKNFYFYFYIFFIEARGGGGRDAGRNHCFFFSFLFFSFLFFSMSDILQKRKAPFRLLTHFSLAFFSPNFRSDQRRIQAIKDKRAAKEEKERYEKMAEKMHRRRVERLKRREKRNKLLNS